MKRESTTNRRREAARRRLSAAYGQSADDADRARARAGAALDDLLAKVNERGPLAEEAAATLAAEETRQMRIEKRTRGTVSSAPARR